MNLRPNPPHRSHAAAKADPNADESVLASHAVPAGDSGLAEESPQSGPSSHRVLRSFVRQPVALAALAFLLLVVVVAIFAPLVAPANPQTLHLGHGLEGPSWQHLLGTDNLGRDALSQLIFGARISLLVSGLSVGLAFVIGVPPGLMIGFLGGWTDSISMRLLDLVTAVPGLIISFAIIAVLGAGLTPLILAIAFGFAVFYVRLARGLALVEKQKPYVEAARVSGLRKVNLLFRQVLPNIMAPLVVQTTIYLGSAMLIEAALTFLGFGLSISQPSWGGMLSAAQRFAGQQPFLAYPPGVAITLTVLAFNLLGDGLRDALSGDDKPRRVRRIELTVTGGEHPDSAGAARPPVLPADRAGDQATVLTVESLSVALPPVGSAAASVSVLRDVSFSLAPGEVVGLAGESGSGKTMTCLAIMGLLPAAARVTSGQVWFDGTDLIQQNERRMEDYRGRHIAMVFQDPLSALSPTHTVGQQICAGMRRHHGLSRRSAKARAGELLALVGVADPVRRLDDYPHEFSGGMAQRVTIAMALASEPAVLIADEPTTALDVTVQGQVLDLLADLREQLGLAILLCTHDLGVIADSCSRALIMYAGMVVEEASTETLFSRPRHPYTAGLIAAMPAKSISAARLPAIAGQVPAAWAWPAGCRFHPRCAFATDACRTGDPPPLVGGSRCLRADDISIGTLP